MGKPVKTLKILDRVFNWLKTKSHHVIFFKEKAVSVSSEIHLV